MAGAFSFTQSIPHLAVPVTATFATVEQDSDEHIQQCVYGILSTRQGSVTDDPRFGVPDQTFKQQPLNTQLLQSEVVRQEPRAQTLIQSQPDALDALIANVQALIPSGGGVE